MKPIYSLRLFLLVAILSGWNLHSVAQTTTLNYSGGLQTFQVPAGVTLLSIDMQGAKGGNNYYGSSHGGYGGRVRCNLIVTPGQILNVYVGGQGSTGPSSYTTMAGGYNGGGSSGYYYCAPGGGGTDIRTVSTDLTTRLVVAGGGGGASYYSGSTNYENGGDGGGLTGGIGLCYNSTSYSGTCYNSTAGTQTSGGSGTTCGPGSAGGLGVGGNSYCCYYGGGGGGGYYGGGGAYGGGGSGGSSFTSPSLTMSVTHTQGYNSAGNGAVVFSVPTAGAIVSTSGLSFTPTVVGSRSAGLPVSLFAYNLSPASGTLTATVPSDFQVSTDGGTTWTSGTFTFPYSGGGGTIAMLVRFVPTLYSSYSSTVSISGGGMSGPVTFGLSGLGVFPCTGTPTPGTASISPSSGNLSTPFSLNLTGASSGAGITYQWQQWSFGSGGFGNIPGATNINYSFTGISNNTYFQCVVTCPTGGTSISNTILATLSPAAANCSGLPNAGSVYATAINGCVPSLTTSLYIVSPSTNPGIVYNWQTSADNINWTNISGATGPIYNGTFTSTTYVRDSVTCINSLLSSVSTSQLISVNPLPTTITGATNVCTPNPSALSSTPLGGTWSSANPSIASVNLGTGVVTGVTAGATNITYTLPTGCITSTSVAVNAAPAAIGGSAGVCMGSTTPLFESSTGGRWSSLDPTTATVGTTSGIVTGVLTGATTIVYTLPSGCTASKAITVNPLPAAITGSSSVCVGSTTVMSDPTPGGTWYSSTFATTVGATSGIVTGMYSGANNIIYKLPTGCLVSLPFTINALPASISGTPSACVGAITSLSTGAAGTWTTSNASILTVSGTGDVTGVAAGVATVRYTSPVTGCSVSAPVTINALPVAQNVTGGGSYCSYAAGVHVGLSNSVTGINYQLYETTTGTPVGAPMPGSSSALDFGAVPVGTYTVQATNATTSCASNMSGAATVNINMAPNVYNVTGGGNYCLGGAGMHVTLDHSDAGVNYQVYNGTLPVGGIVAGTGATTGLDLGLIAIPGTYTVKAANAATACASDMAGSTTIGVNMPPAAHNVMGGGNYCLHGTGVDVSLDVAEPGVTYQLYNGTTAVGAGITGVTGMLDFGNQTGAGHYTVVGTDNTTFCPTTMDGGANININPLPVVFNVTGGGNYCASGTGVHVGLNSSATGTTYTLMFAGAPVGTIAGSNSGIDFGIQSAPGAYTATATIDATGCTTTMAGTSTVGVNALPDPHVVTGGGPYCAGTGGSDVQLDASDMGISYQLYKDGIATGPAMMGTGTSTPLDFGNQTAPGTYTVGAVNTSTSCALAMSSTAVVTVNANPAVYTVQPGGAYCAGGAGVHIMLNNSQSTVNYQVMMGGIPMTGLIPGTGTGSFDLGTQTAAGVYTVIAIDGSTPCSSTMASSATVAVNPLPAAYAVSGGGNYCSGSTGRNINLAVSNTGINYTLSGPGGITRTLAGTGFALDFGAQTASGAYTISAVNPSTGCTNAMTGSSAVNMITLPTPYTVTGSGQFCAGGTGLPVSLSLSDTGVNYQLMNGSTTISTLPGTGATLTFAPVSATGTYTVKAVNATYGCTSNMTANAVIVSNPLPAIYGVTGGGSFCNTGAGVHVGVSASTSGITYKLYNGGTFVSSVGSTGTGAIDFGVISASGAYTAVALNPITTCSVTMTGVANVNPITPVVPSVTVATASTTVCSGDATTFSAVPVNGGTPTYVWTVGGSPVSTSPSYTYSPANGDVVMVTMTGNAPCATTTTANNSITMTVDTKQTPSVTLAKSTTGTVCPGSPVTFSATPVNGGTTPSYSWKVNGNPMAVTTTGTYTYTPADGDVVFLVMSSSLPCRTATNVNSNNVAVTVDNPVTPDFSIAADPGFSIAKYNNVTFSLNVVNAGNAPTITWKVNNATVGTASTFSSANLRNGDTVSATMTSNSSCGARSTTHSVVLSVNSLGVQETSAFADVKVVPNPNKGIFIVKGSLGSVANQEVSLEITNMLGQVVYSSKVLANGGNLNEQVQLNNNLANGVYLLNIRTESGNSVLHFVIEN